MTLLKEKKCIFLTTLGFWGLGQFSTVNSPLLPDNPGDSRLLIVSPGLQIIEQWWIQGGPPLPLFLDQTEAQWATNIFLGDWPLPLI